MGGGTGGNLEYLGDRIHQLSRILVVDLCASLLEVARNRIIERGWKNVEAVAGDATSFQLDGQPADVVTFSYSLTMIPNWFAAIENAWRLLRPGGVIGVVDFYVSQKYPPRGQRRHSWLSRTLWPAWFGADNVHLGPDRLAYLQWRFRQEELHECKSTVPYLPGARVPCFVFIGRK
jgi:S-adenosylmethionine-diacylgycerolhomoserine-N-methlytransferase